jgi:hypothetical protein
MTSQLSAFPTKFATFLDEYHFRITEAIRKKSHHHHRRALLIDFLSKSFGIEIDEIELEKRVKAAEARGRIEASVSTSSRAIVRSVSSPRTFTALSFVSGAS